MLIDDILLLSIGRAMSHKEADAIKKCVEVTHGLLKSNPMVRLAFGDYVDVVDRLMED